MYVAGYSFYLLNNAFTNHWGFQSLKTRPQWRARQQEQNNARFDEFAKEVSLFKNIILGSQTKISDGKILSCSFSRCLPTTMLIHIKC
jgi:hypothetical protein